MTTELEQPADYIPATITPADFARFVLQYASAGLSQRQLENELAAAGVKVEN